MGQDPYAQCQLRDYCCGGSPLYSPSETKNKNSVKNCIYRGADKHGIHCDLRVALSADNIIQRKACYPDNTSTENNIQIISIPGPAAFLTALAGSGLPTDSFAFYGFLPKKKGKRKKKLEECMHRQQTAIFYESPRRIDSVLSDIEELDPNRQIVIGRELTKTFEQYIRGSVTDVISDNWQRKGEIVLLMKGDE